MEDSTFENNSWTYEDLYGLSQKHNHPAVVAVIYNEDEKLQALINDRSINVVKDLFDYVCFIPSYDVSRDVWYLKKHVTEQSKLIDIAMKGDLYYEHMAADCVFILLHAGAKLVGKSIDRTENVLSETFLDDLLICGFVKYEDYPDLNQMTEKEISKFDHKFMTNWDRVRRDALDKWKHWSLDALLYCFDRKNLIVVFT